MGIKPTTASYLLKNDAQAVDDILSHNEFGEKIGCWKAPVSKRRK